MRHFRVTSAHYTELDGVEFEVEDDATEEDIAEAAFAAIAERVSYGWEEITKEPEA